jgi:alpha-L-rhamnosidase
VRDIRDRGWKLSTGFVGSPYLPHVLTEAGKLDVAYRLLHQTDWPSWLYAVTQGATTIWERWDGWTRERGFQDPAMNSFNHYAYGAIGAWLYQVVAGIDVDPQRPGYKHLVLRPRPGPGLTSARATLDSVYGRVESDWRFDGGAAGEGGNQTGEPGGGLEWRVIVPPNTTATVHLPAGAGATVTLDGGPPEGAEGVTPLRRGDGEAVYDLAAGRYRFVVTEAGGGQRDV